jgi:hypothetical protein
VQILAGSTQHNGSKYLYTTAVANTMHEGKYIYIE